MSEHSRPDTGRDRDATGRARNARPRDELGRPLARDAASTPPGADPPPLPPQEALAAAQELLDAGRPFEAHEVLEAVWKAPETPATDRELWRGLAQLAVGVTHQRRGNTAGASALLRRAAETLATHVGERPHGVAVDALRDWAEAAAAAPADAGATQPPPLRA